MVWMTIRMMDKERIFFKIIISIKNFYWIISNVYVRILTFLEKYHFSTFFFFIYCQWVFLNLLFTVYRNKFTFKSIFMCWIGGKELYFILSYILSYFYFYLSPFFKIIFMWLLWWILSPFFMCGELSIFNF